MSLAIVVVREQRVGAKTQEFREGGIVAQRRGFAKVLRHRLREIRDRPRGRELASSASPLRRTIVCGS